MNIDTYKLTDLVESVVLQQVQNTYTLKNQMGIAIFDDMGHLVTQPFQSVSFQTDVPSSLMKRFFNMFLDFIPDKNDANFFDGKTIFSSFANGLVIRAFIPVMFQDSLLGLLGFVKYQRPVDEKLVRHWVQMFEQSENKESAFLTFMDSEPPVLSNELHNVLDEFKTKIYSQVEAGWERLKYKQNGESHFDYDETEFEKESDLTISVSGDLIYCSKTLAQQLGYDHVDEIFGLNFINSFIIDEHTRFTLKTFLLEKDEIDWRPLQLEKKDGSTCVLFFKFVPRNTDITNLFEYDGFVKKNVNTDSERAEIEKDKSAIEVINQRLSETESIADTLQNEMHAVIDYHDEPVLDTDQVVEIEDKEDNEPQTDQEISFTQSFRGVAQILDTVPYPLFVIDENDQICVWNNLVENIFDILALSVLSTNFSNLLLGEAQVKWDEWIKTFRNSKKQKELHPKENISLLDRNGNIIKAKVQLSKNLIIGKEFISVTINEWEKVKEGKKLKQTSKIDKKNVDATIFSDNEGKILYANDSTIKLLNEKNEKILALYIHDLFRDIDVKLPDDINRKIRVDKAINQNVRFMPEFLDGAKVTLSVQMIENYENDDQFLLWTIHEIEPVIEKVHEEPAVPKTTPAKNVQKLDEMIQFTKNASFNINYISSELDDQIKQLKNEDTSQSISQIIENLEKLSDKVKFMHNRLESFSRTKKVSSQSIHLNKVVKKALEFIKEKLPYDITIKLDLDESLDVMPGDFELLSQVVQTLCFNSFEAMPDGGDLYICTFSSLHPQVDPKIIPDDEQQYNILQVKDNGRGISKAIRPHLFEPFMTTKMNLPGAGLNLSAVYGIIKNHDGHINIKTKDDEGTTFTIFLPVKKQEPASPSIEGPSQGLHETILLIDDDTGIVEVNSITLKHFGYSVITALTAEEGLALVKKYAPAIDLIILDVTLPDMPGSECALKIHDLIPGTPVILSSGYHYDDNLLSIMDQIGAKWLQKPFTTKVLLENVQEMLVKRKN